MLTVDIYFLLSNQSARKVLFTCLANTNIIYFKEKGPLKPRVHLPAEKAAYAPAMSTVLHFKSYDLHAKEYKNTSRNK